MTPDELQAENDRLTELNRRLANQVVGVTDRVQEAIRPALKKTWDAGFTESSRQHRMQRDNPDHPITRVNPYEDHEPEGN